MRLVLASASPRRAELLRAAGFSFETAVTDVDERPNNDESPSVYVRRLAAEKSAAAVAIVKDPSAIILGADTTVVVDGDILAKPADDAESAAMLRRLSGRAHEVLTSISLRRGAFEIGRVESTTVHVVALSADDVAWYVASGEGLDKAGAYAIQGLASRFIPRIVGSYSNVVGLPIASVVELLRDV